MSGYIAEFEAPDGSTATLSGDDVIAPTVPDEHSVINEWSFETPASPSLEAFRHGRVTLWFEADTGDRRLIQTGPIDAVTTDDARGRTTIRAHDDFQTLAETGPEGTIVADGEAADEIERVWSETAFTADVTKPEPRLVGEGRIIQDGDLTEVFSDLVADPTAPFVVSSGEVRPAQAGFTLDLDPTGNSVERDDFSNGTGQFFGVDGQSSQQLGVGVDYTIPSGEVAVAVRGERTDGLGNDIPFLFFDIEVNGTKEGEVSVFSQDTLGWAVGSITDLALTGGEDVELVLRTNDNDDGSFELDAFAVLDDRFDFTLDNEVTPAPSEQADDEDGYLDGPEEIPPAAQAVADTVTVENSITAADLTVVSDTANNQSLAIEFGPTGDFAADLSGNNTQTLSGDNPGDLVSDIRAAVTLGYTDATRDTQTPRTGFEAQELTSWELAVDEVSIIVFNGREFSGNYYQILQEMHREGGLIFRNIPTAGSDLKAETFEKGALTDTVEWTRLGFDRGFEGLTEYANVLTAVGGEADDGTRPVVTVQDDDEIGRVGDEKPAFRLFESRTEERALLNRAQAELRGLTDDQLSGSVEIVPRRLKPGYAYEVDAFDGETAVLQRMRFEDGTQPRGSLEFLQRRDVSNAISGVRRETRSGER